MFKRTTTFKHYEETELHYNDAHFLLIEKGYNPMHIMDVSWNGRIQHKSIWVNEKGECVYVFTKDWPSDSKDCFVEQTTFAEIA